MRGNWRQTKYGNHKVTVDGIEFDSKKEYHRWCELRLLERAGEIRDLRRQVEYELIPNQYETVERFGKKGQRLKDGQRCIEKKVSYVADFVYEQDGKTIVEDTKGYRKGTAYSVFVIKRKLMLKEHGLLVKEV